ncbi:MAG: hypothetical protein WBQ78_00250 [Gammaproteobacteria bacterium]
MKRTCAMLALVCALLGPGEVRAASDDMFGMMFRMMLTMMNVMSDAMLGNNVGVGNNNWSDNLGGGLNSFNVGMNAFPMMSGFASPFDTFGMSPWSGMSGMSPWSGMSGMSPWSGMSPRSMPGGNNAWRNPFGSGYPGMFPGSSTRPFGNTTYGYPSNQGAYAPGTWNRSGSPYQGASILDGRWYGSSGEVLQIRGNRFRLQQGKVGINGNITVQNDIVSMYSPQTNSVTRYTFMRNQSGLVLQDASGTLLRFTNKPVNGIVHIF